MDLKNFVENGYEATLKNISKKYQSTLYEVFNVNKNFFPNTVLDITIDDAYKKECFSKLTNYSINQVLPLSNKKIIISKERESFDIYIELIKENDNNKEISHAINNALISNIIGIYVNNLLFDFNSEIFMLPAERGGLNLFFKELNVSRNDLLFNLNEKVHMKSFIKKVSKYSLPVSDYINFLNQLSENDKNKSKFSKIASYLENNIIEGKYDIDNENTINFISKSSTKDKKIDLHIASSTAKNLFGLSYYLEHTATIGDVLIIDEPELSLHPDNQRKIARALAMIANKGTKVIISTHSDYIVKEINNLITLGRKFNGYEKFMSKYSYNEEQLIDINHINAYILANNSIKEVDISDEGLLVDTFDNVINSYNKSADDIYYAYIDTKGEE